jgi:hypothetical protein
MTLAEAGEIFRHWEQNPPAHLILQTIARLLGWSPPAAAAGVPDPEEFAATPPPGLAVTPGGDIGCRSRFSILTKCAGATWWASQGSHQQSEASRYCSTSAPLRTLAKRRRRGCGACGWVASYARC